MRERPLMFKKCITLLLCILTLMPIVYADSQEDTFVVGASFQTLNNEFYTTLSRSIKSYVESNGGVYIAMDSQVNLQKQTSDVEDMVQIDCDIIIIAPIDTNGSIAAVNVCKDAGVPIICVNSGINSDYVSATIETDNYLAGVLMAQYMVQSTEGTVYVGMMEYNLNDAGRERSNGFLDTIADYDRIKIVARQECDTTTESAVSIAEDMMIAHPELNAFFSINDPTAYGIYSAAQGLNKENDILIVSCDGCADVLEWIRDGRIESTVTQLPWQMGQFAAKAALDLLRGLPYDQQILVAPHILTTENLHEYEHYFSEDGFIWPDNESSR